MGSVWSRDQPSDSGTITTSVQNKSNNRKRKLEDDKNDQAQVKGRTENEAAPDNHHSEQILLPIDPTPDGEYHRFMVRCDAMFWSSRKDVQKQLSKIIDMPPYGGLHKIPKWGYFFITFPNSKCARLGKQKLSAASYRGKNFVVEPAPTKPVAKRARTTGLGSGDPVISDKRICHSAADATAGWRNVPYDEQIRRKVIQWEDCLKLVTKELLSELKSLKSLPWLEELVGSESKRSPCCPLTNVTTADKPSRTFYRNKNELTIGLCQPRKHPNGSVDSELTIGYSLGLVRDNRAFIAPVDQSCVTTGKMAIAVANILTPVLRNLKLPAYDKLKHEGFWRQITCRESSRTGELIVLFSVNGTCGNAGSEDFPSEQELICRQKVVKTLRSEFESKYKLGIFWQRSSHHSSLSSADFAFEHLHGIEHLHEELGDLRFRIDPAAFFQVNTRMAEVLYKKIEELALVNKDTVILDVCCGTGTIGLCLARKSHSVVGIELIREAVVDAEHNALLNEISNARFITGKAEEKIHEAVKMLDPNLSCVAILDPPRAGLPMKVIAAIRAAAVIKKVIFVACEPKNLWRNALGLCRPASKAFKLSPFRPVKAEGVDLFPHTRHGELVVLFER